MIRFWVLLQAPYPILNFSIILNNANNTICLQPDYLWGFGMKNHRKAGYSLVVSP